MLARDRDVLALAYSSVPKVRDFRCVLVRKRIAMVCYQDNTEYTSWEAGLDPGLHHDGPDGSCLSQGRPLKDIGSGEYRGAPLD